MFRPKKFRFYIMMLVSETLCLSVTFMKNCPEVFSSCLCKGSAQYYNKTEEARDSRDGKNPFWGYSSFIGIFSKLL